MNLQLQKNSFKQLCKIKPETKISDIAALVDGDSLSLPKLSKESDGQLLLDLLLTAISLTPKEKVCLLLRLPEFTMDDVDRLIAVLQGERETAKELYQDQTSMFDQLREKNISEIKEIIANIQKTNSLDILKNDVEVDS